MFNSVDLIQVWGSHKWAESGRDVGDHCGATKHDGGGWPLNGLATYCPPNQVARAIENRRKSHILSLSRGLMWGDEAGAMAQWFSVCAALAEDGFLVWLTTNCL